MVVRPGETGIAELVGVYRADGGPVGEARYVIGKLLGTRHCALCDITHSPVRRKPAWDAMVRRLQLPMRLVHLNEMAQDVAAEVKRHGSPLVLARLHSGGMRVLLGREALEALGGSVASFEVAVRTAIAEAALS